jgi:cytochrome c oxidase subunit I+III
MTVTPEAIDVSGLPEYAFGHRSRLWWGTAGFIVIETTAFALAVFAYFYLRSKLPQWPPGAAPPDLLWGTLNTLILLVSAVPNQWAKNAAEEQQLGRVRLWLVVCIGFGVVFLIARGFEFTTLNCAWDTNAYGSIVWAIMGLHTAHLLTDVVDTSVLTALMFTRHAHGRRFVDVSENAFYWYFVVLVWLPLYAVIYWVPRLG